MSRNHWLSFMVVLLDLKLKNWENKIFPVLNARNLFTVDVRNTFWHKIMQHLILSLYYWIIFFCKVSAFTLLFLLIIKWNYLFYKSKLVSKIYLKLNFTSIPAENCVSSMNSNILWATIMEYNLILLY